MLGIMAGILSGFILSTQLDLSNMEAFQRGLRRGFREAFLVGLGSTMGDAIYWIIMLLGQHKIINGLQSSKIYVFIYAIVLLVLGLVSFRDLKRLNENKPLLDNKILVFMMQPLVAGFVMSVLTPSTMLWSFVVTEIFEESMLSKIVVSDMEAQIFVGLVIGGILWAACLAFLSTKSKVLAGERFIRFFILINGFLFFISSITVLAKIFV